jgi:hypothetical protein
MKPPSNDVIEKVRGEFGLNEQRVRDAVEHLKDWIQLQPHLPTEIDDGRLERWLIRCKNNTEKVKKTLDLYYTLTKNVPEIMTGWDTKGDWFKTATNNTFFFPMPQLTPNCERVLVLGFQPSDGTEFSPLHMAKIVQLVMEIRCSEDYCVSDILLVDYANISPRHVTKFTPDVVKKYELCAFTSYNIRFNAAHILNAQPHNADLISLFKRVPKKKLASKIQVHGDDWTSFYEQVPKECLPNEYGGKAGTVAEHWDLWKERLQGYRDIFLERESYSSDESKRPSPSINISKLLGFEGSSGKPDVD